MPNPSSPSWRDFELPDQGKKSVNLSYQKSKAMLSPTLARVLLSTISSFC
jgi:hypothetical protein